VGELQGRVEEVQPWGLAVVPRLSGQVAAPVPWVEGRFEQEPVWVGEHFGLEQAWVRVP